MSITFRDLILYNIRNLQNYMVEHDLDDIEASFETLDVGIGDPERFVSSYKLVGSGDAINKNLERYSRNLKSLPEHKIIFTYAANTSDANTINHIGIVSLITTPDFKFLPMSIVKFLDNLSLRINRYNHDNLQLDFSQPFQATSYRQTNRMIFKKSGKLICEVTTGDKGMTEEIANPVRHEIIFDVMDLPTVRYPIHGHLRKVKVGELYIDCYEDINVKPLREIVFGGNIRPDKIFNNGTSPVKNTGLDIEEYKYHFTAESIIGMALKVLNENHSQRPGFDFFKFHNIANKTYSEILRNSLSIESLKNSGMVDVRDINGNTALMLSIIQDRYHNDSDKSLNIFPSLDDKFFFEHLFRELHSIGASLSIRNNQGDDALSLSVKHQNVDIIELIFELDRAAGFTTFSDLNYQGVSIMDLAIATEDQKIIELMDEYVLSRSVHQVNPENAVRSPRKLRM